MEPGAIPEPFSDNVLVEFLKKEADHFYESELHSEQRASWLLTIAFAGLAAILNAFVLISEGKLNARTLPALRVCCLTFFVTICSSLWALWPLQGGRGTLSLPWRSHPGIPPVASRNATTWEQHYVSHRRRAEIKVGRVVVTLIWLMISIFVSAFAVLLNAGFLW